jgi:DNA-binding HxlR family transcriptional regulator
MDAGYNETGVGRSPKDFSDSFGYLSVPVRPSKQIKALRRTIHLADLNEAIASEVNYLVDPETIPKVRRYNEIPPRVEYRLTKKGQELVESVIGILQWMRKWAKARK